jgi:hypothetical protein
MQSKFRYALMAIFAGLSAFSYRATDSENTNLYQVTFGICVFVLIWLIAYEISKYWNAKK